MPGLEKAPDGEYLTDRLGAEAERFIDANKDRPFFLYLAHYGVHIPMKAPNALVEKYPGKLAYGRQSNPIYAAMLESVDTSVGNILKKLDALKLADRTLVVFTSDNGGLSVIEGLNTPPTINAPLREGKGFLYEGGIRVPLLVRWPGVVKPGASAVPVISHDLYPTLLSACGVKVPAKIDGVDLTPLLAGKGPPERDALFWHYPHYSNQGGKPGAAVREGNLKLIEFYEDGRRELFDVAADAGENRNLARDRPEDVKRLAARLEAWRKETGARMPRPNPDYVPNPPAKDGTITMHARTAHVTGTQLRYEPLPHKETLGFWVDAGDTASWQFTATKAGHLHRRGAARLRHGAGRERRRGYGRGPVAEVHRQGHGRLPAVRPAQHRHREDRQAGALHADADAAIEGEGGGHGRAAGRVAADEVIAPRITSARTPAPTPRCARRPSGGPRRRPGC